jgi:hypothetical protein
MEELLPAREIAIREFNSLRGRLCTVIESAGLQKKQERALVLLIKNLSYQNQAVVSELIDRLETEYARMEERAGMGSSGLQFRYSDKKLD